MKLYLIKRTEEIWYDQNIAMVVAAENEEAARMLCTTVLGDEDKESWLDSKRSDAVLLAYDSQTTEGIVLTDFNAG